MIDNGRASCQLSLTMKKGELASSTRAASTRVMSLKDTPRTKTAATDLRTLRLLEAALTTFGRFGFRKASMEEVAKAARVSRQGLYLHFATKEELFRAAVQHLLDVGNQAVAACLGNPALSLEDKLVVAFDAWVGPFVGVMTGDPNDLEEASTQLLGSTVQDHENDFLERIAKLLRISGLHATYKSAGLSAHQLVQLLYSSACGLKHLCKTRAEFSERFRITVRALCMPLRAGVAKAAK